MAKIVVTTDGGDIVDILDNEDIGNLADPQKTAEFMIWIKSRIAVEPKTTRCNALGRIIPVSLCGATKNPFDLA